jgi:succinate dehydrogenase/fumarate reductase flavoprotein subunit
VRRVLAELIEKLSKRKETGTMANLKATEEEWGKLEEVERAESVATEYGRVVDDLLYRTVRDLAEARAGLRRNEKRISDAEVKLNRAHWNERRLVDHLKVAVDAIHETHFKTRPRHKRSTVTAALEGCALCKFLLAVEKDVQEFGRELAR